MCRGVGHETGWVLTICIECGAYQMLMNFHPNKGNVNISYEMNFQYVIIGIMWILGVIE